MAADNDLIVAVGRMKKGEEEGFNLVYQKTYNYVYFRARQIMKDDEDALDLVQIVYIEAYKSIDTLDKPENIFAWLGAITYRQGMKIFRKKNEILLDEELKEEVFGNIVSEDTSTQPELSAEQKEQQKAIQELIDQLPEAQRTTLVAFYYDGLTVDEIADTMECSSGTVKSRLNYARNFLRKHLEGSSSAKQSKVGAMAITGIAIYGAIQAMSEQTVMAAPVAQNMYNSICQGVGIAAGTLAIAGGVAGAGVSAAGAAAGASATGSATTAATVSAGNAAASAAVGASASAAAAGGTAAGAATTAATAATTAATVGTAKSVAVAVAVAVAGTGVGTAVVTNNSETKDVMVSADHVVSLNNYPVGDEDISGNIVISANEIISDNSVSLDKANDVSQSGNNNKSEEAKKAEESSHSDNTSKKKKKDVIPEKDGIEEKKVFTVSNNARERIANSAASVLFYTGKKKYDSSIDNDTLNAAYQFGQNIVASTSNYTTISKNEAYIDMSNVGLVETDGKKIKMKGTFVYGKINDKGEWEAQKFSFTLSGKVDEEDTSLYGIVAKKLLIKPVNGVEALDMGADVADSTVDDTVDNVSDITEGLSEPEENEQANSGAVSDNSASGTVSSNAGSVSDDAIKAAEAPETVSDDIVMDISDISGDVLAGEVSDNSAEASE